jgi:foldase protein PrsA
VLFLSNCSSPEDENSIAEVGAHKITLDEFSDRYLDYLVVSGLEDKISLRKAIVRNMVNEKLLYYYDDNKAIFNNPEYQKEVEWAKKQVFLAYLKDIEIYSKIDVTDEELRQAFVRVNEKIEARHLYAPTFEEAEKLYNLVQSGVSFEELSQSVFTDSTLRNNGGYLGYFTWGDMDPSFEKAAYSMNVGEVSKPVKTAKGYSIIKVENRARQPLLTEMEYLKKKNHLARTLKIKKKIPYENKYVNSLFDKSKYKVNDELVNAIFSKYYGLIKSNEEKYKLNNDDTCVEYDGEKISVGEIVEKIKNIPAYHLDKVDTPAKLKVTIENVVKQDLLIKEAIRKNYDENINVINKINEKKLDIFLKYKKDEVLANASISDSLVSNYYNTHSDLFYSPRKLNLQEIIVKDKAAADLVLSKLNKSKSFAELAKEYSLRRYSAENGGFLGLSEISRYGNLKDTFWNADIDEVVGPLKIENYYGIFRIAEKEESKLLDLQFVIDEVSHRAKLLNRKEIFAKYFNLLKEKVDVKINEEIVESYKFEI